MTGVLLRRENRDPQTQREGRVNMEAAVGAMHLPAKECQGVPAATGKLEESRITPRASEGAEPYHPLDFTLLDSEE